jgi:hypothetical protein
MSSDSGGQMNRPLPDGSLTGSLCSSRRFD